MKRTLLRMIALVFWCGLSASMFAQALTVTGAGSDINGGYNNTFTYNGKNAYERSTGNLIDILWSGSEWRFTEGSGTGRYYFNPANTTVPPAGGWQIGADGSSPAPELTGSVAPTVIVIGAGSTVVNGLYAYEDVSSPFNGKNVYRQVGGAGCGMFWQYSLWQIRSSGGGVQYYINAGDTPIPPTGAWQLGTDGAAAAPSVSGNVDPLPAELVAFNATAKGLNAELKWNTATEVDNSGFEIERRLVNPQSSIGNSQFTKIGFVGGSGTSTGPKQYAFIDRNLSTGLYSYRLKQVDRNGTFTYSRQVQVNVGTAPRVFSLGQNYPNPFNPSTTVAFTVPNNGPASLRVYNSIGQEVATLFDGTVTAGEYHQVTFDGSRFASGVYFARLQFGGKQLLKKMLMVK